MSDLAPVTDAFLPAVPARTSAADLKQQSDEIRVLMKSVLQEGTDFGQIPGTPKPTLLQPGAQWLLKWAQLGFTNTRSHVERDEDGRIYGVTYTCAVHLLSNPGVVVATCDGYCGYDEPDREAGRTKWGKDRPRSPLNTLIKMSQKRALVGAALAATATSGLFTQDVEDMQTGGGPDDWFIDNGWEDRADHAMWREPTLEVLKGLSAEQTERFKTWRQEAGIGPFTGPHTKVQAQEISKAILRLKGAPSDPPPPDPVTPPTGRAAEVPVGGDSVPVDGEALAEAAGGDGPGVGVPGGAPTSEAEAKKPTRARAKKTDAAPPTEAQVLRLFFTGKLPAYDRPSRLDVYSAVAGRDITSGNELDEADMGRVRDAVGGLCSGALVLAFTTAGKPVLQAREAS